MSTEAASFGTGFVTSAGKLQVNKLVQTADFTSGVEWRLLSSANAARSIIGSKLQRFALTGFFGFGAVGPFPLANDSLPVFVVPDSTTPQGKEFAKALPSMTPESVQVTSKYVAFRPEVRDRFLVNYTVGLRLYTFYANENGEPLQTSPAIVSIAWGRNDLVAPWRRGRAWHISAFYPFAVGDRADPTSLILFLFGDVWMSGTHARFDAPGYQLQVAKDASGKAVTASNKDVTIVSVLDSPRDTYRVGVTVDLLKVWQRLLPGGAPKGAGAPGQTTVAATGQAASPNVSSPSRATERRRDDRAAQKR